MLGGDDGFCRHQGHVTSLSSRDTHRFPIFFALNLIPFRQAVGGATTEEEDACGRCPWRGAAKPRQDPRVVLVLRFQSQEGVELVVGFAVH